MSLRNILLDTSNEQLFSLQADVLRVNELDVDNLGADTLYIGTQILPLTGGIPWIGTTSLPFKNVASTSFTGTNMFSNNLKLITTGGTGTNLSYYEEISSTTSTVSSSIWSASKACTWKLTRIGRTVILNVSNVSAQADVNTPGKILHDEPLPSRFWPTGVYPTQIIPINNNTAIGSETTGDCEVSVSNGIIAIGATPGGGNFTGGAPGANVSGFRQFSISWQI